LWPLTGYWEDVVEVSFRPATPTVELMEWDGDRRPLDLEQRDYRVRYCAYGMDLADEDDAGEQYLLQFWPAPPDLDKIVRQETQAGEYRNSGH